MSQTSRLLNLANGIQARVAEIQKHLSDTGKPDPTFDGQQEPTDWTEIDDTRAAALEDLTELRDLLCTPRELVYSQAPTDLLSRHAFDRFGVYEAVPLNSPISYEDLSQQTKIPVKHLQRLVRHAITQRIFHEPQSGFVAHTQASRLLTEDIRVRDWWAVMCDEIWPSAARTVDAMQVWMREPDSQETAYRLAHGREIGETLAADSVRQKQYDSCMSGACGNDRTWGNTIIAKNWDWASLGDATVVDVGGGIGNQSKTLARTFPRLNIIIQDRPETLCRATVEDLSPDVRSRVRFLEHDMFTPQPQLNADVYLIRRVMMAMPDAECIKVLRCLRPALRPGAHILVQDPYLPKSGGSPVWQERTLRNLDLLVLTLSPVNSREPEAWPAIFEQAGPGFDYKGMKLVPNTDMSIVEAVWRGE